MIELKPISEADLLRYVREVLETLAEFEEQDGIPLRDVEAVGLEAFLDSDLDFNAVHGGYLAGFLWGLIFALQLDPCELFAAAKTARAGSELRGRSRASAEDSLPRHLPRR